MLDSPALPSATEQETLRREIVRLNKVVKALMDRAERSTKAQASDFTLFEATVMLEDQVRKRTVELESALRENEVINQALREAERKYRGIFDDAIVGVFQSDVSGGFLSVNPFMARMFGYCSPEDMIASITDIAEQFYANPREGEQMLQLIATRGRVQNFECLVRRKDGSKFWITASVRSVSVDGAIVRYEGMLEDVTEQKHLREQLLQAQKLESVGQLAAGIAHEINTPTQFIGDNVHFLKDAFSDMKGILANYNRLASLVQQNALTQEVIREVLTEIERLDSDFLQEEIPKAIDQALDGVNRVSTLVSAMKDFSHPGTKEKSPTNLNRAIESTITVARNEWKYVADVETDYDQSLPMVPCLIGEFNQVILNLIVNAVHAISDTIRKDGRKKRTIRIQTKGCAEFAEIRVADDGGGISPEIRSRVFDPFFTTKEVGKGTGQGLSIARSVIVDKHQGSIHFETEEGVGTTFTIRLPYEGGSLCAQDNPSPA
jgi:PAS domain S-box-containing protein